MVYDTRQLNGPAYQARGGLSVRSTSLFLLWVAMASSSFVLVEPAPFDILMAGLIIILPLAGVAAFNRRLSVFLILWLLVAIGGIISSTQASDIPEAARHTAVTVFLSLCAVVIGLAVFKQPERAGNLVMSGLAIAALMAALLAFVGYFDLVPGARALFTKFDRARAAFKDPNVYGAFLVPALVYALHRMASARTPTALLQVGLAGFLCAGLLISFSRGAWLQAAFAITVYTSVAFVASRTDLFRLRLFVMTLLGIAGAALGLIALLQIEAVSDLLTQRANLAQRYDMGAQGRFGGQFKALDVITQFPGGIGALEFGRTYHHEDVHNVYLSMFLNSGWIGGFAYLALVLATLFTGLAHSLKRTPHQGLMVVMLASFAGMAVEGLIIDSDHWRHYYVIMGMIWGLAAVNDNQKRNSRHQSVRAVTRTSL